MLNQMLHNQMLVDSSEIVFDNLDYSTEVLVEDSTNERKRRMSESKESKNKKKDSENKLLVVYPFGVDEAILSEAASGLKELGGDLLGIDDMDDTKPPAASAMQGVKSDVEDDVKGKSSRTHYIIIRDDDVERLCPGQFLNDTLVDFWMRW
jgi:Ulp1 family protease